MINIFDTHNRLRYSLKQMIYSIDHKPWVAAIVVECCGTFFDLEKRNRRQVHLSAQQFKTCQLVLTGFILEALYPAVSSQWPIGIRSFWSFMTGLERYGKAYYLREPCAWTLIHVLGVFVGYSGLVLLVQSLLRLAQMWLDTWPPTPSPNPNTVTITLVQIMETILKHWKWHLNPVS